VKQDKEWIERNRILREEWLKKNQIFRPDMDHQEFLNCPTWKNRREKILRDRGQKCEICSSGKKINVHHNNYAKRGTELDSDLIVLCRECHHLFHSERKGGVAKKPETRSDITKMLDYELPLLDLYEEEYGKDWLAITHSCATCARKPIFVVTRKRFSPSTPARKHVFCRACHKIFKDRLTSVQTVAEIVAIQFHGPVLPKEVKISRATKKYRARIVDTHHYWKKHKKSYKRHRPKRQKEKKLLDNQ